MGDVVSISADDSRTTSARRRRPRRTEARARARAPVAEVDLVADDERVGERDEHAAHDVGERRLAREPEHDRADAAERERALSAKPSSRLSFPSAPAPTNAQTATSPTRSSAAARPACAPPRGSAHALTDEAARPGRGRVAERERDLDRLGALLRRDGAAARSSVHATSSA